MKRARSQAVVPQKHTQLAAGERVSVAGAGREWLGKVTTRRLQGGRESIHPQYDTTIWWIEDRGLIAEAQAQQESRYHADAWDSRIDRWLAFARRRVNHGYPGYDDWREEDLERVAPLADVSVGEISNRPLGSSRRGGPRIQMWVGAYLKSRKWGRYQRRVGSIRE